MQLYSSDPWRQVAWLHFDVQAGLWQPKLDSAPKGYEGSLASGSPGLRQSSEPLPESDSYASTLTLILSDVMRMAIFFGGTIENLFKIIAPSLRETFHHYHRQMCRWPPADEKYRPHEHDISNVQSIYDVPIGAFRRGKL